MKAAQLQSTGRSNDTSTENGEERLAHTELPVIVLLAAQSKQKGSPTSDLGERFWANSYKTEQLGREMV